MNFKWEYIPYQIIIPSQKCALPSSKLKTSWACLLIRWDVGLVDSLVVAIGFTSQLKLLSMWESEQSVQRPTLSEPKFTKDACFNRSKETLNRQAPKTETFKTPNHQTHLSPRPYNTYHQIRQKPSGLPGQQWEGSRPLLSLMRPKAKKIGVGKTQYKASIG